MPLSHARDRDRKRAKKKVRLESERFQPNPVPQYNPLKHKAGDTVRFNGQVVTIPSLDADGQPIW